MKGFTTPETHGKWSLRASATGELVFDNVRIPAANVLGEVGKGFYSVMKNFQNERIVLGAQALGEAQTALALTLAFTAAADDYFPPPDSQGGWRTASGAKEVREKAGLDLQQPTQFVVGVDRQHLELHDRLDAREVRQSSGEPVHLVDNDDLDAAALHIRKQPLTVQDALLRSLAHASYHVGQIVYIAKAARGAGWHYLSIPPGQSDACNRNPTYDKPDAFVERAKDGR